MGRKPSRTSDRGFSPDPVPLREVRRAKVDIHFDNQSLLIPLFGQFDANLVQVENRLGVFISARGDHVQAVAAWRQVATLDPLSGRGGAGTDARAGRSR